MPGKSKSHKDRKDRSSRKASHSSGRGIGHSSNVGSEQNIRKQVWSGSAKSKKAGCLSSLFMLTMSFIIIGSYLFLDIKKFF